MHRRLVIAALFGYPQRGVRQAASLFILAPVDLVAAVHFEIRGFKPAQLRFSGDLLGSAALEYIAYPAELGLRLLPAAEGQRAF
ncbi:hypothetical protein SDC9_186838 [bioreactor metagenome]|uniref:Uncharacterized protein n=1 Tax=bioreactor metagenome TaxID=1076179 RepID=A0A645HKM8_9ZZZZ